MAKVKYVVREYIPTENQQGTHSFYAQARPDNTITNAEIARKIENRGISRASEIKMILEEASKVILEEVAENNRVQLDTGDGVLVSIYARVSGSISDTEVQANPAKYGGAQAATEDMLTPDRLQWSLGATVGTKYSKQFALNKQAEKVPYRPGTDDPDTPDNPSGGTTPSGNDDPNSGND